MTMDELQKQYLINLINQGKDIPEDFKALLFPESHLDYELTYAGKMRKEDILTNEDGTFPVPLQSEKLYGDSDGTWNNILVYGDNLQFLKTIYENEDLIIKDKIKGKIKMIYIDPPFATEEEFQGKEGEKAYSDKKKGAEFIEFLRRRLIVAREILADDGVIYVHMDWKKVHYIKMIMDEIFGENHFKNEIIWKYFGPTSTKKNYPRKHDVILFYSKSNDYYFDSNATLIEYDEKAIKRYDKVDENGDAYKIYYDDEGNERRAYLKDGKPTEVFNIPFVQGTSKERIGYPTQKPEALISRLIRASTKPGDLIMDFFAGSGTTLAVAEKLGRRWVGCDIGKLSYYLTQKRIIKIAESRDIENPKIQYKQTFKPFLTCSLGIYDLKKALELEWTEYVQFVSGLFEITLSHKEIKGVSFEGIKRNCLVKIFNYQEFSESQIDEEYINSIHGVIGDSAGDRVYLVAPANFVNFLSDYYEIDNVRYYFLKIPYTVIKELHNKPFAKLRQPKSKNNINSLEEAIGFYFNRVPEVKTEVERKNVSLKITIRKFRSNELDKSHELKDSNEFDLLSAVFIDADYNNEYFTLSDYFFNDEMKVEKDGSVILKTKISQNSTKIKVIYVDIYGNEFAEEMEV